MLLVGLCFLPLTGLERIGRAPFLARLVVEALAFELVGAGLRGSDDRRTAQLIELRLVVRGDDLVFTDAKLREWIAARECLTADATAQHVILLTHSVDEYVDAVGRLRAAAHFARAVPIGDELHAGHDVGEREEVARVLRQRFDLPLGDVRGHLGGFRFVELRRSDRHFLGRVGRSGCDVEIQGRGLAHLQDHGAARAFAVRIDFDLVSSRR